MQNALKDKIRKTSYLNSNADEKIENNRKNSVLPSKKSIDKYDSTEELKNLKPKIIQNSEENLRTISNNAGNDDSGSAQMMYKILETRINDLEKEVSYSM